jgi:hypothetical protein
MAFRPKSAFGQHASGVVLLPNRARPYSEHGLRRAGSGYRIGGRGDTAWSLVDAQRDELLRWRDAGRLPEASLRVLERELDHTEHTRAGADRRQRR